MAEPEQIVDFLDQYFSQEKKLKGKKVLLTAGPTYESLDPVRFIGNHSTGKMGFAIAEALANEGAEVELISGPTALTISHPQIRITRVVSAEEMYQACILKFTSTEIVVLSAAVADYKPVHTAEQKIKKSGNEMTIELTQTRDIAKELGKQKKKGQLIVGFALETENERSNAQKKMISKNFDLIVLNSLNNPGAGFGHDTNQVVIFNKSGALREYSLKSKKEIAVDIVNAIADELAK
jgi:phosphopantothenoylcysteine decarboxylase/phosphopantothenate--cysteine ligase